MRCGPAQCLVISSETWGVLDRRVGLDSLAFWSLEEFQEGWKVMKCLVHFKPNVLEKRKSTGER